nr:MAG TPA: hypothetical protein [Caudoviricetes sp.]
MNAIQIVCCLVALCLSIILDIMCHSYGYTMTCLFTIAVLAVVFSYDYRKRCEEADRRRRHYQQHPQKK